MADSAHRQRNDLKSEKNNQGQNQSISHDSNFLQHSIQGMPKEKKQVINLQSSSEKQLPIQAQQALDPSYQEVPPVAKPKPKKTTFKCQLCKGTGKKTEMKNCTNCKLFFHINCLQENEVRKKYICDKCRIDRVGQGKANKKQKKLDEKVQKEVDKTMLKKMQRERKKDECHRILGVFKQKYPYYVGEDNKIKYPIEDKLLFIYKEYFQPSEFKQYPVNHPSIPPKYVGDFLELENFIVSFEDEISVFYEGQYKKSHLFPLMNCEGSDITFEALLSTIIRIYLKDIFQKNKTQNIKILNDQSFFIILSSLNQVDNLDPSYLAFISPEVIRYLSTIPSMKKAFDFFEFPQVLNLDSKLRVLISLIQGLSEVDSFHDMVSRKSQKMSEMTKQKANLVSKLKKDEAQALSNKEKLKQMLTNIADKEQNGSINEDPKYFKELEKNKKKTVKMTNQGEQSEVTIRQFKEKIVKISKMIPFAISEIMFLGTDRNKSNYFFFLGEPNRIYVRYHNFLLDTNQDYKIYEGKEKILQLFKCLNTKGINEKHLHQSISLLLKEDIIRNLTVEEQNQELTEMEIEGSISNKVIPDVEFREKIVHEIIEIQEKFSNYLAIKNCQWASPSKREDFMLGFSYIQDISALKQSIKTLQESFLFVEVIKQRQILIREESDSNNEQKEHLFIQKERQLSRRKKPIRLWGMNAEKIKKYWADYLEETTSFIGIWICTIILKSYVRKYLQKKLQALKEQERKEQAQRQKQIREQENRKLRELRERELQRELEEKLQNNAEKEKKVERKQKLLLKRNRQVSMIDLGEIENSQPSGRARRILRKSTRRRNKALTIDSDEEEVGSENNDDDECGICGEVGEMVCCDTCPKVFHLDCVKLKQVPEGQWSCMSCLERLTNARQTRSKMRRLTR